MHTVRIQRRIKEAMSPGRVTTKKLRRLMDRKDLNIHTARPK